MAKLLESPNPLTVSHECAPEYSVTTPTNLPLCNATCPLPISSKSRIPNRFVETL